MAAEFVTVTWTELDVGGTGLYGQIRFTLSGAVSIGGTTYELALVSMSLGDFDRTKRRHMERTTVLGTPSGYIVANA